MVRVGLIGLGAMGRVHFDCWRRSGKAQLSAICSRDRRKLAGDWGAGEFNLGDQAAERVDLTGIAGYEDAAGMLADPGIDIVDLCLPTQLHAPLAIAALRAGKNVFCEKPMALTLAECDAMCAAAGESGRELAVGHCLRYWPHYVGAKEMLDSGEFGRAKYARFSRTGAAPTWSAGGWLMKGKESGGVLDMHIHDIDVALWWFGRPEKIAASGVSPDGLPLVVDASWQYRDELTAQLHSAWDRNGGAFRHAFQLVMENATLLYDLASNPDALILRRDGKDTTLPMPKPDAYAAQLDDFAACVGEGRKITRITPADSRLAVEVGLEELRQLADRSST